MHILRHIDRRRFQMDFLVHTDRKCAYDEELRSLGATLHVCPDPIRVLSYSAGLLRVLRKEGPYEVVHSHLQHLNGLVMRLASLANVPIRVAHSHSNTSKSDAVASLRRRMYTRGSRHWIARHSTHRIAASNQAGDSLFGSSWRSDCSASLLYCGIDVKPFTGAVNRSEVRRELGLTSSDFVLGHVGRFVHEKNHSFLLQIFFEILKVQPQARLLLVGQGPLEARIRAAVKECGIAQHVTFAGARSDVARIMRGAMDAFVFPSLSEGLGLAAVEAQVAGLPTILSDQIPWEADIRCGVVKFISIVESAESWANRILKHHKQVGIAQHDAVAILEGSRFSLQRNLNALGEIYAQSERLAAKT